MSDQLDFEVLYGDDKLAHGVPAATPWDIGEAQPFVKQLVAHGVIRSEVLDPGTGPGHNPIYLASQGLSATGVDGSASAIERAKANARAAGVSPTFQVGDATMLDGFDAAFDTVVDSAFFHALALDEGAQARYLRSPCTGRLGRRLGCTCSNSGATTSTGSSVRWGYRRKPSGVFCLKPAGKSRTWAPPPMSGPSPSLEWNTSIAVRTT